MSDIKFTPGPWRQFSSSYTQGKLTQQDVHHGLNAYRDGPQGQVCVVTTGNRADAHLIAAAPDMYEALQQAITSMQDSGYQNSHVAIRAGKAALAKAEGKS